MSEKHTCSESVHDTGRLACTFHRCGKSAMVHEPDKAGQEHPGSAISRGWIDTGWRCKIHSATEKAKREAARDAKYGAKDAEWKRTRACAAYCAGVDPLPAGTLAGLLHEINDACYAAFLGLAGADLQPDGAVYSNIRKIRDLTEWSPLHPEPKGAENEKA